VNDRRTDRVFKALADPTRRRMLDLMASRPRTTGELAAAFPKLSRFAVMKHLTVLRKAGLLIASRDGRKRWNAINAAPLVEVLSRWAGKYQQAWADVLLNVRDAAEAASVDKPDDVSGDDAAAAPATTDQQQKRGSGKGDVS
jgi:DNA-binding transcriptional ArsR family regulator